MADDLEKLKEQLRDAERFKERYRELERKVQDDANDERKLLRADVAKIKENYLTREQIEKMIKDACESATEELPDLKRDVKNLNIKVLGGLGGIGMVGGIWELLAHYKP